MTVKEINQRIENLKNLANNVRLLNQWAINEESEKLNEIAEKHGMNSNIPVFTKQAYEEIYQLADCLQTAIDNTEVKGSNLFESITTKATTV